MVSELDVGPGNLHVLDGSHYPRFRPYGHNQQLSHQFWQRSGHSLQWQGCPGKSPRLGIFSVSVTELLTLTTYKRASLEVSSPQKSWISWWKSKQNVVEAVKQKRKATTKAKKGPQHTRLTSTTKCWHFWLRPYNIYCFLKALFLLFWLGTVPSNTISVDLKWIWIFTTKNTCGTLMSDSDPIIASTLDILESLLD